MEPSSSLAALRPSYERTARRIGWADLPGEVRRLIDVRVGGDARAEASAGAGFTPGFAARVQGSGGCWFVKAAGAREAPFAAESYLVEARINSLLPDAVPAPRLRWMEQTADGWVVLGFDAVDGRIPRQPWRPDELAAGLRAYAVAAEALTPAPDALAQADLEKIAACESDFGFWRRAAGGGVEPAAMPPFVPGRWVESLAELEEGWSSAVAGESVLHNDLRADNILIDSAGAGWICDWNWATLGAPWLDLTVLLAVAFCDGHDADALLAAHPAAAESEKEQIDVALAGFAGMFLNHWAKPEIPGSPALRGHQRYCGRVVLEWLAARLALTR